MTMGKNVKLTDAMSRDPISHEIVLNLIVNYARCKQKCITVLILTDVMLFDQSTGQPIF